MTEPVTPTAPRPIRRTLLSQSWLDLAFLHWAVPPEAVEPLLPAGAAPDVLGEVTYVGLIAFRMHRIGWGALPGLPYLGTFPETNVRLYSVDTAGRRGVVFRSLEASRLLPVLTARVGFRLPYTWAKMAVDRRGEEIAYTSRRRWPEPRGAHSRIEIRIGEAIEEPTELEHFVTARWGLHNVRRGRPIYQPNEHPRWPLHRAELRHCEQDLLAAAGLPPLAELAAPPVSVLYSPGVPVRFGPAIRPPGDARVLPEIVGGPGQDGSMTLTGRIETIVLDAPDIDRLATFYAELAGWSVTRRDEDWYTVETGDGRQVSFQLAPDHVAPQWPGQERPQQAHLDLYVDGIEAAAERAEALGATRLATGASWITLADPAGHPFDLCQKDGLGEATELFAATIDALDAGALARFYAELLGLEITYDGPEGALAAGGGSSLMFQNVAEFNAPDWPNPERPQQFHLDIMVEDLDTGEARALELGARRLDGGGKSFRVFADPAGHPFCLTVGG